MPEDEAEVVSWAAAAAQPAQTPCAGCRTLRRRCVPDCVFAPYFPADSDSSSFVAVHRVFGASNVARMLEDLELPGERRRAAETLVEEALARLRDPALGCVSYVGVLQILNEKARKQVDAVREEIAREFGPEAAAEPVDLAAAEPAARMEAKAQAEDALAHARKQDAKLLAARHAVDLKWWQLRQAAKHAGEGPRVQKDPDTDKQMVETQNTVAAEESSSDQIMLTPQAAAVTELDFPEGNGHPRQQMAETQESAPAAEVARDWAMLTRQAAAANQHRHVSAQHAGAEQAPAAALQHHDSATTQLAGTWTSFLNRQQMPASEELAKTLVAMIRQFNATQQYHDPAAAQDASVGLDVTPRLQQPPQPRDMVLQMAEAQQEAAAAKGASDQDLMMMLVQQIPLEEGAAEQDVLMQLLAAGVPQHDNLAARYDDTEPDITMGYGHPDMHQQTAQQMTEAQRVAAAAGEVAGEQGITMRHAAAADLAGQETVQAQQLAAEAQVAREQDIMQQVAAAQVAREQDIMQQVAAAQVAREQEVIIQQVAAAELVREQEMIVQQAKQQDITMMLQAAAAQYSETEQQLADAVRLTGEPNTPTMQLVAAYTSAEHGSDSGATVAFQPPGSAEAAQFLVEQQPPPQGQTARALGLQLDSSLPPLPPSLGQPHAQVPQQSSDLTEYLYY